MATASKRHAERYSCLKADEGGMSESDAITLLGENGILAQHDPSGSPYVGHYGLIVFGDDAAQEAASELLFGE